MGGTEGAATWKLEGWILLFAAIFLLEKESLPVLYLIFVFVTPTILLYLFRFLSRSSMRVVVVKPGVCGNTQYACALLPYLLNKTVFSPTFFCTFSISLVNA